VSPPAPKPTEQALPLNSMLCSRPDIITMASCSACSTCTSDADRASVALRHRVPRQLCSAHWTSEAVTEQSRRSQVEEIMLLNTTVRRWDGAKCYYPTAMLNAAPLLNLSRSENRVEAFKACVLPPSSTSSGKLANHSALSERSLVSDLSVVLNSVPRKFQSGQPNP